MLEEPKPTGRVVEETEEGAGEDAEKTARELRKELIGTGKVKEFVEAKELKLPPVPKYLLPFLTNSGLELIDRYLSYPTIVDVFTKHEERRKWRHSLPKKLQAVYDKNAIRLSSAGVTLNAVDFIISNNLEFMELFKEKKENLFTELVDGWRCSDDHPDGVFTLDEKRAFLEKRLKPFLLHVREAAIEAVEIKMEKK